MIVAVAVAVSVCVGVVGIVVEVAVLGGGRVLADCCVGSGVALAQAAMSKPSITDRMLSGLQDLKFAESIDC